MQKKSGISDGHHTLRACGEINQDTAKAEGLHEKVSTRKMSSEILTSSLALEAHMRRVEKLECQHRHLQ